MIDHGRLHEFERRYRRYVQVRFPGRDGEDGERGQHQYRHTGNYGLHNLQLNSGREVQRILQDEDARGEMKDKAHTAPLVQASHVRPGMVRMEDEIHASRADSAGVGDQLRRIGGMTSLPDFRKQANVRLRVREILLRSVSPALRVDRQFARGNRQPRDHIRADHGRRSHKDSGLAPVPFVYDDRRMRFGLGEDSEMKPGR